MLSAAERHQRAVVEFDDAKDNELTAEHALTANMTAGSQGLMGVQGETVLENWNRATQRVWKILIQTFTWHLTSQDCSWGCRRM